MRFLLLTLTLLLISCHSFELQEGDLLFQDIDCGPMCDAIEAVTYGVNNTNLSHIALVVEHNDSVFALEAISAGVVLTPINDFLYRSVDSSGYPKVMVGRLKEAYRYLNKLAIALAKEQINTPYDDEFLMNNGKYYCSELLYDVYKQANNNKEFFPLYPMTFKPLNSDEFFPVWEEYYQELAMEIPEGMPGLNPGGISTSANIEIVYQYGALSVK